MRKLWHLCSDLCDLQRTICRTNQEQISKRWSSHRSNWNRPNCKNEKDEVALSRHYSMFHGTVNKLSIPEAYTVTFIQRTNFPSLNICEDKWYHQLNTYSRANDFFCLLVVCWRVLTCSPPACWQCRHSVFKCARKRLVVNTTTVLLAHSVDVLNHRSCWFNLNLVCCLAQ